MEVIKVGPGGYRYGVVDVLQLVRQAIKDLHVLRPVHILGQIIHNRHVVEEFTAPELSTQIPSETRSSSLPFSRGGILMPRFTSISAPLRMHMRKGEKEEWAFGYQRRIFSLAMWSCFKRRSRERLSG